MMKVKICGIITLENANTAVESSTDIIGFDLPTSKRYIDPDKTDLITNDIDAYIKKVGVFVNESVKNMIAIADKVGLDYIQLHGDEPASTVNALPLPVIKAFSIHDVTAEMVQTYPCSYYLIDSPGNQYRGGSGKTFDWSQLDKLGIDRRKCILAGGLHSETIQEAISIAKPAAVDVST